ncbi:MAG: 50S ribosomal protein L7/L12 [Candidatus Andersenbacteria bacterium]|nr:50S ribosomal protein L7/L12 [Candidatus Andersenbacteria bacterium]
MSDEKKEVEAEEKKEAPTKATEDKKEVEVPKKFKDLVKQIEELSVLELSELVKVLEEKFGVSAAAPAMMAAMPQAGAGGEAEAEEKSDFDVELVAPGDAKIAIIKIVREVTGKGLKDAKDIVDAAPVVVKEKAPKAEAEELKKKLEDAGATVNLK